MIYSLETFVNMLEEDILSIEELLEYGASHHRDIIINLSRDVDSKIVRSITEQVTTRHQLYRDLEELLMEDGATIEQGNEQAWDFMDSALTFFLSYDDRIQFYQDEDMLVGSILDDVYSKYPLEFTFTDDLGLLELS